MRAKVFKSGNSQAIRIPKELRFDCDEVILEKVDDIITIKSVKNDVDKWDDFFDKAKDIDTSDFLVSREQPPVQHRDLF